MTSLRRVTAALLAASVLVPVTASASASDDELVTWQQAEPALAAARATPGASRDGATIGTTVAATVPDLSWAIDDATAPAGVRRAACHQVTRLDDETAALLAACLAHVRSDRG